MYWSLSVLITEFFIADTFTFEKSLIVSISLLPTLWNISLIYLIHLWSYIPRFVSFNNFLYKIYENLLCFPVTSENQKLTIGPRQANLLLIAYASSEGSGEPAHPRSLARTSAARSYKQWVKRNLQTESQIPGPSEWLGMRSWNVSWRNARRHKFAWRGPIRDLMFISSENLPNAACNI